MRPGDVFGRLGGEEFACLLAGASMAHALTTAERLRREFAALRVPGLEANATVSVGVAMVRETGRSLSELLATVVLGALSRQSGWAQSRGAGAARFGRCRRGEISRRLAEQWPAAIAAPVAG